MLHVRTDVSLAQKDDDSEEEEAVMNLKGVNGGGSSGSGSESSEESDDDDSDVSELPEVGFFLLFATSLKYGHFLILSRTLLYFLLFSLFRLNEDTLDSDR